MLHCGRWVLQVLPLSPLLVLLLGACECQKPGKGHLDGGLGSRDSGDGGLGQCTPRSRVRDFMGRVSPWGQCI